MAGVLSAPLVIVGAGPAGLAAAHAALERGVKALIIEAGEEVASRRRAHPESVLEGVGGAGLYSDGKFSFFPSATRLWSLADRPALEAAYAWVEGLLRPHGVRVPPFPRRPPAPERDGFKPYPSVSLDLDTRVALIEALRAPLDLRVGAKLTGIERRGVRLRLQLGDTEIEAGALILAGGRFMPLDLPMLPWTEGRLELGLRIQGPAEHPFFAALAARGRSLDPKLILRDGSREWRSFCFCHRGELVRTRSHGYESLSGRADGLPGPLSNVGFNLRLPGGTLPPTKPFCLPLTRAAELETYLGPVFGPGLREGLRRLAARLPLEGDLELHGPAIEGLGRYPLTDGDLRVPGWPVHVAGDATGRFRGLVAALLSGAYLGFRPPPGGRFAAPSGYRACAPGRRPSP